MTKRHLITLFASLWILSIGTASAQKLKIATVDMQRLFNEYHRTNEEQQEINIERARIQKDNNLRLEKIRGIEDELNKLRETLNKEDLSDKERQEATEESRNKFEDGKHEERARIEFLNRRNEALNEKMKKRMKAILEEIKQLVSEKATSGDYDYIFDKSGNSRQGIPFLIHAKDATDLTDGLLKELNANQTTN